MAVKKRLVVTFAFGAKKQAFTLRSRGHKWLKSVVFPPQFVLVLLCVWRCAPAIQSLCCQPELERTKKSLVSHLCQRLSN